MFALLAFALTTAGSAATPARQAWAGCIPGLSHDLGAPTNVTRLDDVVEDWGPRVLAVGVCADERALFEGGTTTLRASVSLAPSAADDVGFTLQWLPQAEANASFGFVSTPVHAVAHPGEVLAFQQIGHGEHAGLEAPRVRLVLDHACPGSCDDMAFLPGGLRVLRDDPCPYKLHAPAPEYCTRQPGNGIIG